LARYSSKLEKLLFKLGAEKQILDQNFPPIFSLQKRLENRKKNSWPPKKGKKVAERTNKVFRKRYFSDN
jgi:hypothetical protein